MGIYKFYRFDLLFVSNNFCKFLWLILHNWSYTPGEKLDLKFTPPIIAISNSISIYIHKHTS